MSTRDENGEQDLQRWADNIRSGRYDDAKVNILKYIEWCKTHERGEELSLAETKLFETTLRQQRTSVEVRISTLEASRKNLEEGVELDKQHGWKRAQVEKQLLLVEVIDELSTLEGEASDDIAAGVVKILDDAKTTSETIDWKTSETYARDEVSFLRSAASLLLNADEVSSEHPNKLSRPQSLDSPLSNDVRMSFHGTHYLQLFALSLQTQNVSTSKYIIASIGNAIKSTASTGRLSEHASLLMAEGLIYYLLLEFDEPYIHDFWKVAAIESLSTGAKKVLDCLENALHAREAAFKSEDARSSHPQRRIDDLVSSQARSTNELDQLCFNVCLELAFGLQDTALTWKWIQHRKARALSNMLRESVPAAKLVNAPNYLELNKPLTFEDLQFVQTASGRKLIFVDWAQYGTSPPKLLFFAFSMSRDRDGPFGRRTMLEIEASIEDLEAAAAAINEARMNDTDAERYLLPFVPVIEPLAECSEHGDILIFSAAAPLYNVPLAAVPLGAGMLIERNPVVCVPSHSALVSCLQRLSAPEPDAKAPSSWNAVIFGAYEDLSQGATAMMEREEVYKSLKAIGADLEATMVLGSDVTRETFTAQAQSANLIHFHGHGILDAHFPTRQSLVLGQPDQYINIEDLVSLATHASHATLIACSGGVQDFSLDGDEPLGLLSALLVGGTSSVIGALWPIPSPTGRIFAEIFYKYFLQPPDRTEPGPVVHLAQALQHTVLKIRGSENTKRHYHWAPFVLYGLWFCQRKPGSW